MSNMEGLLDLESLSREFTVALASDGRVLAADKRAERLAGLRPGERLHAHVTPGTEGKLEVLLARAVKEPLDAWEQPFMVAGRPVTVVLTTRPKDGGFVALGSLVAADFAKNLAQVGASMNEIVTLNREITRQRGEIARQATQIERTTSELDDSNRGVVVLHSELAEKSEVIVRTNELKTRVVANVSHEFRTPLHSILGLSKLLIDRSDGPLTGEQEQQVRFIRTAAEELSALVDDLLDLSKIEAGKLSLRAERFQLGDFFRALRGMMRPLVPAESQVQLVIEEPAAELRLDTDQGKLGQILRNLISNALKFTVQGEVRVRGWLEGDELKVEVKDTGVGIAEEDLERIFDDFTQIENALQKTLRGTGLGLPLSRRLASLMGGELEVKSELGKGSTFVLRIPRVHPEVAELAVLQKRSLQIDPSLQPVLVVEDDRKTIFVYERYLSLAGFQVIPTRTIEEARETLKRVRPAAIVLDVMLEGSASWSFLQELKSDGATKEIPVLITTVMNREQQARALGADEFWLKPIDQERLLRKLRSLAPPMGSAKVLVIDDDATARYLVRKYLSDSPFAVLEAATGPSGVSLAQDMHPDVVLLDFLLQDMTAFDVIDQLKADPRTRSIPIIINTSHVLPEEERRRLASNTEAILYKEHLSREIAINRIRDALKKAGLGSPSPGR